MYKNILAATDGSDLATRGVEHAIDLARMAEAQLTLVAVSEPFPLLAPGCRPGWGVTSDDLDRYRHFNEQAARQILEGGPRLADEAGVRAKTVHVADSRPAVGIVETARKEACDLIVVTSHGRRGLQRLILGSETAAVLVTSSVPVLVVK